MTQRQKAGDRRACGGHRIALFGVLLASVLAIPPLVRPQEVTDLEKRLQQINNEIQDLQTRIKEEEKKESTLLGQLDQISFNIRLAQKELELLNAQKEKTSRDIGAIRRNIQARKKRLTEEKKSLGQTLVTLYKFGKFDFVRFLLQADDIGTLFSESKLLTRLAGIQDKVISNYLTGLQELDTAGRDLETKQAALERLIVEAAKKKEDLERKEKENRAIIQSVLQNKRIYEQALQERNDRARELQSLMKKIVEQEVVLPFPFIPFYEKKGQLPWPLAGKIITFFGQQRHPRFNTVTVNNGIEIAPAAGNLAVQAIHAGKVVYADFFQGYGDLIIIDHGMNYYSLYGHLSEFLVKKGDIVRVGQNIGTAGETGSLKGVCLYLEIRLKTKAIDPLQWLKKR